MKEVQVKDNKVLRDNVIARILGENSGNKKLVLLGNSNVMTGERIGNWKTIMETAQYISDNSKDILVPISKIETVNFTETDSNGNIFESLRLMAGEYGDGESFRFSSNGLSQYCNMLEIPTNYIYRCIEKDEVAFAVENLEFWRNKIVNNRPVLTRITNNTIHGMLSNKYSVFDDIEVLDIVERLIGQYDNYTVRNYCIDPEYLKIRIVNNDKITFNGRELSYGFDVKNSRVGRSSLELNIIVFDHICSNGMIFGGGMASSYSQRHIGIDRAKFVSSFATMIDDFPSSIKYIHESINRAHDVKVTSESLQHYLDKFKAERMSAAMIERVKDKFQEKYENNLFGLSGAITEVAQEYGLENRENMESVAGKIILNNRKTA